MFKLYVQQQGDWGKVKAWASFKLEHAKQLHTKKRWAFECEVRDKYTNKKPPMLSSQLP